MRVVDAERLTAGRRRFRWDRENSTVELSLRSHNQPSPLQITEKEPFRSVRNGTLLALVIGVIQGEVSMENIMEKFSGMRRSMRASMTDRMDRLQGQLRANPTKWAGIAAGAGFGLGMIGRIMRHRMNAPLPHIIIVER